MYASRRCGKTANVLRLRSQPQPCGLDLADTMRECQYAEMSRPHHDGPHEETELVRR